MSEDPCNVQKIKQSQVNEIFIFQAAISFLIVQNNSLPSAPLSLSLRNLKTPPTTNNVLSILLGRTLCSKGKLIK